MQERPEKREKTTQNKQNKQKINSKMDNFNPNVSVIT